jgi:hypothetical protein
MTVSKIVKIGVIVLTGGLLATASYAQTPRENEVNGRLGNENSTINQDTRNGDLSRGEARQLKGEEHDVRQEEHDMARANGGNITPSEQRVLNQQENQINHQINRDVQQ